MAYFDPMFMFAFLPILLIVYQLVGRRLRKFVLLAANIVFFALFSGKYVFWLILVCVIIYVIGRLLGRIDLAYENGKSANLDKKARKKERIRNKRIVLAIGVIACFAILVVLKYSPFIITNINAAVGTEFSIPSLVLPIGISFYTLMAVSYMTDVYRGTIPAEKNFLKIALYLSFFPQIMEGPIARYSQTSEALYAGEPLKAHNLAFGIQRFLWGMFKKFVIADRLAPAVDLLFANYAANSGSVIFLSAILYTCQLYMDFSGTIDMVIGIGEMFGITLPENFRQPFFSKSASEFWRRWHITLGAWLKDYIFYPVSLAKPLKSLAKITKPRIGRHFSSMIPVVCALFCVWLFNGFWHGSDWQFLFFGMYYFVIIAVSTICEPLFVKMLKGLHLSRDMVGYKAFQIVRTLFIVVIGEMFFNAISLSAGFEMLGKIFTDFDINALGSGVLMQLGLEWQDYLIVIVAVIVVLIVGILHERGMKLRESIAGLKTGFRWAFYYIAFFAVTIFGAYGVGYTVIDIIYAGF